MQVRSTAPVRICDIGGWTDTHFSSTGAVVNFAVDLPVHVRVQERPSEPGAPPSVEIHALDAGYRVEIDDVRSVEYNGALDLLKAAVVRMGVRRSLRVEVWADAPGGSGMGTSSSVAVALLAALGRIEGLELPRHRLAELAHSLEVEELRIECGVQDQYAAAFGGVQFMEVDYPSVRQYALTLSRGFVAGLDQRFLVVHSGESRLSHDIHTKVLGALSEADASAHAALDRLRECAYGMRDALLSEDFDQMAEIMNANWEAQKALCGAITTLRIERIIEIARAAGAAGAKVNGAGGGGTVTILCAPEAKPRVRQALYQVDEVEILPCPLTFAGVRTWTTR